MKNSWDYSNYTKLTNQVINSTRTIYNFPYPEVIPLRTTRRIANWFLLTKCIYWNIINFMIFCIFNLRQDQSESHSSSMPPLCYLNVACMSPLSRLNSEVSPAFLRSLPIHPSSLINSSSQSYADKDISRYTCQLNKP